MWNVIDLDTGAVLAAGLTTAQCDRYFDQHGMKNTTAVRA
jgi:hypothetical protein